MKHRLLNLASGFSIAIWAAVLTGCDLIILGFRYDTPGFDGTFATLLLCNAALLYVFNRIVSVLSRPKVLVARPLSPAETKHLKAEIAAHHRTFKPLPANSRLAH